MSTPPPPQGQYPPPQGGGYGPPQGAYGAQQGYAQPQPGYAQPQPGPAPYGQPAQGYAQQQPAYGGYNVQPTRRSGGRAARIIVSLVVLAVLGGGYFYFKKSDPSYAKVGDCVHDKNASVTAGGEDKNPDLVTIACTDPSADAKIVGKESGTLFPKTTCNKYPESDGYYTQRQGSDDFTLCLKFLKQ